MSNKWISGAIPALLTHVNIGSVYCWSLFKNEIAESIGVVTGSIELAFSLAIFFLGMSAAFCGSYVERNVKVSTFLSGCFYGIGLIISYFAIVSHSVIALLLGYGVFMGIGLGLGYLSPIKTLMIWFKEHKGLATGIAISGFGLGKVIYSPLIVWLMSTFNIKVVLLVMAVIGMLLIFLSSRLIKKPDDWVESTSEKSNIKLAWSIITNKVYIAIWIVFYLNITCGLSLISFEKTFANYIGMSQIALLASCSAVFNTLGRFGYAYGSDFVNKKSVIYMIILISSALSCIVGSVLPGLISIMACMFIVNAGYGGGFSTLPTLLQSKFGMSRISTIHGLALSAWAWAGLSGNQLSNLVLNILSFSPNILLLILGLLYSISLFIIFKIRDV